MASPTAYKTTIVLVTAVQTAVQTTSWLLLCLLNCYTSGLVQQLVQFHVQQAVIKRLCAASSAIHWVGGVALRSGSTANSATRGQRANAGRIGLWHAIVSS